MFNNCVDGRGGRGYRDNYPIQLCLLDGFPKSFNVVYAQKYFEPRDLFADNADF